ncbi:MAG: SDR family NAD(P)-dependent oxidoreductase [Proteobacteria bacterium]|nr:SDR family NAD(P)-dependent oxidoreductase [Pseudomonadota bacterium]
MPSRVHLLTGATSGLGLEAARRLLADPANHLVVGARSPEAMAALRLPAEPDRLVVLPLDLASLDSTVRFARAVEERLAGRPAASLAANAGLQFAGPRRLTADDYEETFQVNLLSHAVLIERLVPCLAPGAPIVLTASGTHDPGNRLARFFGFRGGLFPDVERVARGDLDATASVAQQAKDRYATSKLCTILYAHALARRLSPGTARVIAFDPGLMPGTGLARDRSAVEQWAWSTVLPILVRPFPGASTARRSGEALAEILLGRRCTDDSGVHVDHRLVRTPGSADSLRRDWQDALDGFVRRIAADVATPTADRRWPTKLTAR